MCCVLCFLRLRGKCGQMFLYAHPVITNHLNVFAVEKLSDTDEVIPFKCVWVLVVPVITASVP